MTNGQKISEEDLALFVMGSLDPSADAAQRLEIETHMAQWRESLSAYAADTALLGLSVDQLPLPSGARERFLERIASEPRSAFADERRAAPESRSLPFVAPGPEGRRPGASLLPWMLAAAMFAAAAYLGSQVSELRISRDQARSDAQRLAGEATHAQAEAARAQEVLEVLTAPAAQQVTLTEGKLAPAPTGRTSYLPSRGALVFIANNLHPLPASKAYELWIIPANGHAPISAGVFRPDQRGMASVVLPPLPVGVAAKAFGVTIERAEGSAAPTLPIILSGS